MYRKNTLKRPLKANILKFLGGNIHLEKLFIGTPLHINQIRDLNDFFDLSETSSQAPLDTIFSWHGISFCLRVNECQPINNDFLFEP